MEKHWGHQIMPSLQLTLHHNSQLIQRHIAGCLSGSPPQICRHGSLMIVVDAAYVQLYSIAPFCPSRDRRVRDARCWGRLSQISQKARKVVGQAIERTSENISMSLFFTTYLGSYGRQTKEICPITYICGHKNHNVKKKKFHEAKVNAIFCGHIHLNAGGFYKRSGSCRNVCYWLSTRNG
ncbi:hypothetical protein CEXT_545611 [Caerostris extrusa]|uniref:Uncharacterized protein n=1 Tax=Caerostris extrusa TaxID=172846 RepID=A0AAV4W4E7_CAEEX|nr:hypothetical protein CEXT_545611 [Caerostris extrusa]